MSNESPSNLGFLRHNLSRVLRSSGMREWSETTATQEIQKILTRFRLSVQLGDTGIDGYAYPAGDMCDPGGAELITLEPGTIVLLTQAGYAPRPESHEPMRVFGTSEAALSVTGIARAVFRGGELRARPYSSTGG